MCDIAMHKSSIMNAVESCLHLLVKCQVDLLVFRSGITNGFQSKEPQNAPNFIEPIQCGDHPALEILQNCVSVGFVI
jgi:hypothetical protein